MTDEILARIETSAGRRVIGVGMLFFLGGLLIYVALTTPPQTLGWQLFLIALGGISLWAGERMRQATKLSLELTRQELRDSSGEVLARVDDMVGLDRGMFAFKPSNGFILKANRPQAGRWRPGLYWRMGRRIGVGGVTPGSQTKMMADMIAALIAERS